MEPRMLSLEETEGCIFRAEACLLVAVLPNDTLPSGSVGGGELCLRNLCVPPNCLLRERVILRHNG